MSASGCRAGTVLGKTVVAVLVVLFTVVGRVSAQTCRRSFAFLAINTGQHDIGCPSAYPDDKSDEEVCYKYCGDGSEPSGPNMSLCTGACPTGYEALNATTCQPVGGQCDSKYTLRTLSNGTQLCLGPCSGTLQNLGTQQCITPCNGTTTVARDNTAFCVTASGQRIRRTVSQRPSRALRPLVLRRTIPRESAPKQCPEAFVEVDGVCVLGCPTKASTTFGFSFDDNTGKITCRSASCPTGTTMCGDWCIATTDYVELKNSCAALTRVLDSMCQGPSCGCYMQALLDGTSTWEDVYDEEYGSSSGSGYDPKQG